MSRPRGGAWKRTGRLNGSDVAKLAKKVWICQSCGTWHYARPAACISCGVLAVFDFFHSEGEAKRWANLLILQRGGRVRNLRRQVPFPLMTVGPKGLLQWAEFVADFTYEEHDGYDWVPIVEDYKPVEGPTPDAALKLRCLEAQGTRVRVMTAKGEI